MIKLQQALPHAGKGSYGTINKNFTIFRSPFLLRLIAAIGAILVVFLFSGRLLQALDPTAGILDLGILTLLLFGLLAGFAAICCSIWLQELLWKPFWAFRQEFRSHFNQLTSWQQAILYFSVFFLLLYGLLWALAIVL